MGLTGGYYNDGTTHLVIVDTVTGAQLGNTVTVTGTGNARYNADESRIVLTTNSYTSGSRAASASR